MKLIYTDTDGQGNIDVVHANTCRDGKALLRKADGVWNWEIFEAETRAEAFEIMNSQYDLGGLSGNPELHFCPCVTIA
jgi:hypothetical protein